MGRDQRSEDRQRLLNIEREREELKAMWVEAFRKGPEMQALILRAIGDDMKRVGLLRPDLDPPSDDAP